MQAVQCVPDQKINLKSYRPYSKRENRKKVYKKDKMKNRQYIKTHLNEIFSCI